MSHAEHGKGTVRWSATVDQVGERTVLLDVDGVTLKVPRELLGTAGATVREGDGFTLSFEPDHAASEALKASVQGRIASLTASGAGAGAVASAQGGGSPVGLGAMPGLGMMPGAAGDGSNEPALDLARDDDANSVSAGGSKGEAGGGDGSA